MFSLDLNQFATVTILPASYVSVPGGDANFECIGASATLSSVQWLVNGTQLETLNLPNLTQIFFVDGSSGILIFEDIPLNYHNTDVQCSVTLSPGSSPVLSDVAHLLLQGMGWY